MSSEFPYVEWSQSSAKGRGRTAYLELLYAAKKIGKKGVETQSFAEPEAIGVWKSLERRGLVYLKEFSREDRGDEGIYKVFKATITPKGESFVEGEINPTTSDIRYLPEGLPKAIKPEFSNPRRSDKKYNNPALARSISSAISGASTNKEK
jgi:hypothetical protein